MFFFSQALISLTRVKSIRFSLYIHIDQSNCYVTKRRKQRNLGNIFGSALNLVREAPLLARLTTRCERFVGVPARRNIAMVPRRERPLLFLCVLPWDTILSPRLTLPEEGKATPAHSCTLRGMNFTTEVLCCTCQARTVVPLPRFERQTIWCGFNCVIGNLVARTLISTAFFFFFFFPPPLLIG